MSPALKYSLGRIGIFLGVAVPTILLLPVDNLLVKLMVAILASAVLSFFLLRRWRDELAAQIQADAGRRQREKARLHAALAGEDNKADPDGEAAGAVTADEPPAVSDGGDEDTTGGAPQRLS